MGKLKESMRRKKEITGIMIEITTETVIETVMIGTTMMEKERRKLTSIKTQVRKLTTKKTLRRNYSNNNKVIFDSNLGKYTQ